MCRRTWSPYSIYPTLRTKTTDHTAQAMTSNAKGVPVRSTTPAIPYQYHLQRKRRIYSERASHPTIERNRVRKHTPTRRIPLPPLRVFRPHWLHDGYLCPQDRDYYLCDVHHPCQRCFLCKHSRLLVQTVMLCPLLHRSPLQHSEVSYSTYKKGLRIM